MRWSNARRRHPETGATGELDSMAPPAINRQTPQVRRARELIDEVIESEAKSRRISDSKGTHAPVPVDAGLLVLKAGRVPQACGRPVGALGGRAAARDATFHPPVPCSPPSPPLPADDLGAVVLETSGGLEVMAAFVRKNEDYRGKVKPERLPQEHRAVSGAPMPAGDGPRARPACLRRRRTACQAAARNLALQGGEVGEIFAPEKYKRDPFAPHKLPSCRWQMPARGWRKSCGRRLSRCCTHQRRRDHECGAVESGNAPRAR